MKCLNRQWQQFLCMLLGLLLIANQIAAAVFPPVVTFFQAGSQGQRPPDRQAPLLFPLEHSDPPKRFPGPPAGTADLIAKLARLHSGHPQKLEMRSRERLNLGIIPLDSDGNALHGLKPQYQTSDSKIVGVLSDGRLIAGNPGAARITVRAGSQQVIFDVIVTAPPKQRTSRNSGNPGRTVKASKTAWNLQTTDFRFQNASLRSGSLKSFLPLSRRVAAATIQSGPPVTNHDIYATGRPPFRTEPSGSSPSAAMGSEERPGSANFSFSVPAVSLAGRGLDVALSLFYNSHLWNKSGNDYYYDEDKNWLAPGFALGLGKLTCAEFRINPAAGQYYGHLNLPDLIQPDGTHHILEGYGAFAPDGYIRRTYDGSQMRFIEAQPRVMRRNLSFLGTMYYPNGMAVEYGAGFASNVIDYGGNNYYSRNDTVFPTKITDRHGNYILINYVNGVGPEIDSIQDTLGRYVRFYYAPGGDLVTITVPGYDNGGDRQTIRFYYEDLNVVRSFTTTGGDYPGVRRVLKYIYLPGTQVGWKYEYSSYGMIYKASQLRGMTVSTTATGSAGSVTAEGQVAAVTEYNYPTTPSNLSDYPRFTTRTDTWAGQTSGAMVYMFSTDPAAGTSTVTAPDGTMTITGSNSGEGLVSSTTIKKGAVTLSSVVIGYDYVYGSYQRPVTVTTTNEAGQSKTVQYGYDTYYNVNLLVERDYSGNELRRTETLFETGSGWTNRWLISLPKTVTVKDHQGLVVAKTDYTYDNSDAGVSGSNLVRRADTNGCDDIFAHNPAFDPGACEVFAGYQDDLSDPDCADPYCYWYGYNWSCDGYCPQVPVYQSPYDPATAYRGNLTKIRLYENVATGANDAKDLVTSYTYDVAGNKVAETASCCQLRSYTYTKAYEYAWATELARGNAGQLKTRATYDKNTGLARTLTDENDQVTTFHYYPDSLRPYQTVRPDGGTTTVYYGDLLYNDPDASHQHSYVLTRVTTSNLSTTADTYQFFNGRGDVARTFGHYYWGSLAPGQPVTLNRSTTDIEYDNMGRPYRTSNPYYVTNGSSSPINPSNQWMASEYDDLSRVRKVTGPDGAFTQTTYNGNVTTYMDQTGKQRRHVFDALGRLLEAHEPDASGDLGSVSSPKQKTVYPYSGLDKVVKITQGITPSSPNGGQTRWFKHDSMGRPTHERQAEQDAPHYETDSLTGNNYWSRKIEYDNQGLVTNTWDARSVRTSLTYDGLNRVSAIAYYNSNGTPHAVSPTVTYTYDVLASGFYNKGRLTEVRTDALGNAPQTKQQFDYDLKGRITSHRQIVGSNTYAMSYTYNLADQMTSQTYPTGRVISYYYLTGFGLNSVYDSSRTYVSGLIYTAYSALQEESFGNSTKHTVNYNSRLQVSQISLTKTDGTPIQRYDYQYGKWTLNNGSLDGATLSTGPNNGQIAQVEGFIGSSGQWQRQWQQRFSYDALSRLEKAGEYRGDTLAMVWRGHYGYDLYGNRYQSSAQTQNANLTYTTVADADIDKSRNRFVSGVTYDAAGNTLTDNKFRGGVQYAYDAIGRTVSVTPAGSYAALSAYDGSGQRVYVNENLTPKYLVYDAAGREIAEYANFGLVRENIYRGGEMVATIDSGGVRYCLNDLAGSARALLDTSGSVLARHDYYMFGEEIGSSVGQRSTAQGYGGANGTRTRFAGMERDTSSTDHTPFRRHEARAGRWTSPDPYGRSRGLADPQSFNRYTYVGNDPVNAVDPAGLFTVCVQQGVERSLDGGKTWFVVSSQNICFGGPGFAGTFDQALRTALGFWQGSSQGAGSGQGKRKLSDCA